MTDSKEPREFELRFDENADNPTVVVSSEHAFVKFNEVLHVIEYSAFEQIKRERDTWQTKFQRECDISTELRADRDNWAKLAHDFRDECAEQDKENEERSKEYQAVCRELGQLRAENSFLKLNSDMNTLTNTRDIYRGEAIIEMNIALEKERDELVAGGQRQGPPIC